MMFPMHQISMMIELPVLWALQVRKMGGPLSQLYGHHTALQMTVT